MKFTVLPILIIGTLALIASATGKSSNSATGVTSNDSLEKCQSININVNNCIQRTFNCDAGQQCQCAHIYSIFSQCYTPENFAACPDQLENQLQFRDSYAEKCKLNGYPVEDKPNDASKLYASVSLFFSTAIAINI